MGQRKYYTILESENKRRERRTGRHANRGRDGEESVMIASGEGAGRLLSVFFPRVWADVDPPRL